MRKDFLDCLKRKRDISIKAMSSGGKMAFGLSPFLIYSISLTVIYIRPGFTLLLFVQVIPYIIQEFSRR